MLAHFCLAVLHWLGSAQTSSTYVVDDDGPAQFADVGTALLAAQAGDILLVRPGTYPAFDVVNGVTLVCDAGVITPKIRVDGVPAGEVLSVLGIQATHVSIRDCAGAVLMQHVIIEPGSTVNSPGAPALDVEACDDVRLYRCTVRAPATSGFLVSPGVTAARFRGSRFELSRCALYGGGLGFTTGSGPCPVQFQAGGVGLSVEQGSAGVLALTSVRGGSGSGHSYWMYSCTTGPGVEGAISPGDGGNAVEVRGGSNLVMAGVRADLIRGGARGYQKHSALQGGIQNSVPGRGLVVDAGCSVRYSGVSVRVGPWTQGDCSDSPCFPPHTQITAILAAPGTTQLAWPADPTLERVGSGSAGTNVVLRLYGPPGALAALERGRMPTIQAGAPGAVPIMLSALTNFALGPIGPAKFVELVVPVSTLDPVGARYLWQGSIDLGSGQVIRTNSVPVIVR